MFEVGDRWLQQLRVSVGRPINRLLDRSGSAVRGSGSWSGVRIATSRLPAARGDLASDIGTTVVQNLVHGSVSPASAEHEIKLFFPDRR